MGGLCSSPEDDRDSPLPDDSTTDNCAKRRFREKNQSLAFLGNAVVRANSVSCIGGGNQHPYLSANSPEMSMKVDRSSYGLKALALLAARRRQFLNSGSSTWGLCEHD